MIFWKELPRSARVELVKAAWKKDWSAAKIAAAISQQLAAAITRNVIIGVYDRQKELRLSHPLGGAGADKQRLNAQKRARLTPKEREAKIKEREARIKEREARVKEREEKERLKQESLANVIYLAPTPRPPTPLELKQSAVAYDDASLRLPLMELDHGACRWPVNDPEPKVEEYLFCGHKAKFGSRYCPHHAKRAVIPLEKLRRRKPAPAAADVKQLCNQLQTDG